MDASHEELIYEAERLMRVNKYDPKHFTVNSSHGEWSVMVDDRNGKTMYYNRRTREVRDSRPEGWVRMLAKSVTGSV